MRIIHTRSAWLALLACALVISGCGGGSAPGPVSTQATAAPARATRHRARPAHRRVKPRPAPPSNLPSRGLGRLPQTSQLPSGSSPELTAEMRALWRAVVSDSLAPGLPAFFPEAAYAQVKAIADPRADFAARLLGDYRLDLGAAHRLLGADPGSAQFVRVIVPAAHWVPPGACYNRIGYYEVPNSRLVYRQGGVMRSFGIASMISWRGVWFVVHLGAVVRSGSTGVVDDPATGPGVSIPSSTC